MDIGAWELKIDRGGNTYGQVQRYYVAVVQSLQRAKSPVLALSCVPMLYMELNGATLRVCGAACQKHKFLCEPLTPALHLYCVNNPAHMDTLVRCVCAIRCTLLKLAQFHTYLATQASPAPFQQTPRAVLPYYFGKAYPDACVEHPLSDQTHIPGDSQRQSRAPRQVCCMQQDRSRGGCRGPPCLGKCKMCPKLGRKLLL